MLMSESTQGGDGPVMPVIPVLPIIEGFRTRPAVPPPGTIFALGWLMAELFDPRRRVSTTVRQPPFDAEPPLYKPLPPALMAQVEGSSPDFVVDFSEDKQGFYINGKKYSPSDPPMTTVSIGALHHWRVKNESHEVHPFHIHQVHFLIYAQNGVKLERPEWLDTVNVPVEGNVDLVMDFTDPIIRGMSLFHCHLLSHEDKGMMAKILFK